MDEKECTYTFTGEHPPIILNEYGSAAFMAMSEFKRQRLSDYVPRWKRFKHIDLENGLRKRIKNPDYPYKTREEERIAMYKHENKLREFIIQYLKENYPEEDYAERYEQDSLSQESGD